MPRLLLLALLLVPASARAQTPAPRRVALLVGINEYQRRGFPNLRWAERDVTETAAELRRLGFSPVVTLTTADPANRPTKANIEATLARLLADADIGKNDVVLVMLSGHGQQLPVPRADGTRSEDAFFCPSDAVLNDPSSMLSLSRLTDHTLRNLGGKNIVIVDACRNGPADADRGAKGVDGRTVSLPEGTALLFSCAARQVSLERDDLKHGVFTYALLDVLRDPTGPVDLTWGSLVDRVQNKVAELNPDQDPISATVIPRLVFASRRPAPARAPAAALRAGSERDDNSLKLKLLYCPPGTFPMGGPTGDPDDAAPPKPTRVAIKSGFWLGKYEVTQRQWTELTKVTFEDQSNKASDFDETPQGPDHPMVDVSPQEADEFCRKLTAADRAAGRLPAGMEYRLPTEAQWEYACRAGTTTPFSTGDRLNGKHALFVSNPPKDVLKEVSLPPSFIPVGRFPANAWGFHDMHGNVAEFCSDVLEEPIPPNEPEGDPADKYRPVRGGSWAARAPECSSAARDSRALKARDNEVGFRIALVPVAD